MDISLILEGLLALLLGATLVYCVILERRLRALRKDQDGLITTIVALNRAIAGAEASLGSLRTAAHQATEDLSTKLAPARALVDELALLTASGERIAERIAGARTEDRRVVRVNALTEGLRAVR